MTVIAQDMPGSSLTIAYTNFLQDTATRRFLSDVATRALAIADVVAHLSSEAGGGADGFFHPDADTFDSNLSVNRITASAIGPHRWVVTVEYVVSKFSGLPSTSTTIMNAKVSYESVQVYCSSETFKDGLPFGTADKRGRAFLSPGGAENQDASDPPKPYIYNRPVLSIQVPFSQQDNPMALALKNVGSPLSGRTLRGVTFADNQLRFDGTDLACTAASGTSGALGYTTYAGVDTYSACKSGFFQQRLMFSKNEQGEGFEGWYCENIQAYPRGGF